MSIRIPNLLVRAALPLAFSTFTTFYVAQPISAFAQGTAFTYQGRLNDGGAPASGIYDLRFTIYDSTNSPGTIIAGPITNAATAVSNGLFAVMLDFGNGVFSGADRWLESAVRPAGGGGFTVLSPRQKLTAMPYAIYSANATIAGTANGVAPGSITGASIAPGSISASNIASGQVVKAINGFTDGISLSAGPNIGVAASANNIQISAVGLWTTNGNSGTSPTNGNFIGTTDFQPLELKAGGMRVLRLEPDARTNVNGVSGNLIGGFTNNLIEQPGSGGDFIGGGGYPAGPNIIHSNSSGVFIGAGSANQIGPNLNDAVIVGGSGNTIQSADSVVAGGSGNTVPINASHSAIGGGFQNRIQTNATFATPYVTIGGGQQNTVSAQNATVGGGYVNMASGAFGTVGGGLFNTASGQQSTVPGGNGNVAGGYLSFAAGSNARAVHDGSFVWSDPSSGFVFSSTTSNQFSVRALGGVRFVTAGAGLTVDGAALPVPQPTANDASHSNIVNTVFGSPVNVVGPGVYGATIGGGGAANYFDVSSGSYTSYVNSVEGSFGTVAGGAQNAAGGPYSTIGGGLFNTIETNAWYATISGGAYQDIGSNSSSTTISGGYANSIAHDTVDVAIGGGSFNSVSLNSYYATIAGGRFNSIGAAATSATVGGGFGNSAAGPYATVPGGNGNQAAGDSSFAAGNQARANHRGSFVWSDASGLGAFASTGSNQFLIRATGGVGINTNDPAGAALSVAGTLRATAFQGDGSGLLNVNSGAFGNYVSAYTTAPQTVGAANTFQDIAFGTDTQISGWTHTVGTAQYTNNQTGLYLVQYTAQATTAATSGTNVSVRVTLNSTEIPGSQASVILNSTSLEVASLSRSFLTAVNAADVLTVQFTGSSTSSRLVGTGSGSTRPSASLTITRIQ